MKIGIEKRRQREREREREREADEIVGDPITAIGKSKTPREVNLLKGETGTQFRLYNETHWCL